MPIDPNIALSFKPSVGLADPIQQYGQAQQIQANSMAMRQARNENALAARKLQGEAAVSNAFKNFYAPQVGADGAMGEMPDPESAARSLATAGFGYLIPDTLKRLYEGKEQKSKSIEAGEKAVVSAAGTQRMLLDNLPDSAEAIKRWTLSNYADPVLGPRLKKGGHNLDEALAAIDAAAQQGPAALAEFKQKAALGLGEFTKLNAPKFYERNIGNKTVLTAVPGLGGPAATVAGSELTINLSPDAASAANTARLNRISADERAKLARDVVAERLTPQTNAAGDINFFDIKGNLVKTVRGAGKPSSTFEKTTLLRKNTTRDLGATITQLEKAIEPGGLIEKSTGSGAGALRDKGAAFIGIATEGAVAIGALQPIYDMVLKMVPRFEGPQSNADTIIYNQAAGNLANPNTPKAVKKAAATTILKLMKTRRNQFISQEEAGGGGIVGEATGGGGYNYSAADALIQE